MKKRNVFICATVLLILLLPVLLAIVSYAVINPYQQYVVSPNAAPHIRVGMVLGAGINSKGKPYKELEARLNSGADALNKGVVDRLIVSGDNRFMEYNEPNAMKEYLVKTKHINPDKIVPDYAGRSTYESCERAAKVFQANKLIIFSAGSHLPRAIYLCRHFGIEAYGIASNVEANNSTRRELLARVKAIYNAHLFGESTILGPTIQVK